jgi:hypothetical protein
LPIRPSNPKQIQNSNSKTCRTIRASDLGC